MGMYIPVNALWAREGQGHSVLRAPCTSRCWDSLCARRWCHAGCVLYGSVSVSSPELVPVNDKRALIFKSMFICMKTSITVWSSLMKVGK